MPIKKFLLFQTLIVVLIGGGLFYPLYQGLGPEPTMFIYIAMGLSFLAGTLAYIITYNGIQKNVRFFTTYLIGGMLIKLFAGIISITLVGLTARPFAVPFALAYFISYLIFTSWEVYAILPAARKNPPQ